MVSEDSFQSGKNDVEAYIISEAGGQLYLKRPSSQLNLKYSLGVPPKEEKEIIIVSDGLRIHVVPNAVTGWLEVAKEEKDMDVRFFAVSKEGVASEFYSKRISVAKKGY
jgi:hypothetical protein